MIRLTRTLSAWGSPDFNAVFKQDIEELDATELPLEQVGAGQRVSAVVIHATDDGDNGRIRAKAGVFYPAAAGFSHCDDESPSADEQNEYCELQFDIDKKTADTAVTRIGERTEVGCE